jgi:succinate-acetate transporter protein
MPTKLGNPGVFGLASLGFALGVLGFQFVDTAQGTAGATVFAVLVAAIGETAAGLLSIARGDTWFAAVLTTFGAWLFGYFFLITSDPKAGLMTPKSNGLFILMLIIPLAYYAIPALKMRLVPLSLAFIGIAASLAFLGFGSYFSKSALGTTGGWLSLGSALVVFYVSYQTLDESFAPPVPPLPVVDAFESVHTAAQPVG